MPGCLKNQNRYLVAEVNIPKPLGFQQRDNPLPLEWYDSSRKWTEVSCVWFFTPIHVQLQVRKVHPNRIVRGAILADDPSAGKLRVATLSTSCVFFFLWKPNVIFFGNLGWCWFPNLWLDKLKIGTLWWCIVGTWGLIRSTRGREVRWLRNSSKDRNTRKDPDVLSMRIVMICCWTICVNFEDHWWLGWLGWFFDSLAKGTVSLKFPRLLGGVFFCPFGTVRCLLYRSLFYAGADFMALQWDALLHEDSWRKEIDLS